MTSLFQRVLAMLLSAALNELQMRPINIPMDILLEMELFHCMAAMKVHGSFP